ncbi:MAG TPA: universal stress protein [Solirubrobacteraceae bacterium]|jgi:nucleotide-binding universal stress UspA family protein|nr:universal stress protein [Solirubrobacteraceae bacterium]
MTVLLIVIVVVLAGALVALAVRQFAGSRPAPARAPGSDCRRVLFPFMGSALSRRALDAALRMARAEDATLLPVFLARVPMTLPLDSPLPRQAAIAIPLQEAIEQRAAQFGVPVDARLERGRTYRHALRQTIANERFDRIVIAAAPGGGHGFGPDDVAWLLSHAPGEIVVLRPGAEDQLVPAAPRSRRRRIVSDRRGGDAHARRREPVHS